MPELQSPTLTHFTSSPVLKDTQLFPKGIPFTGDREDGGAGRERVGAAQSYRESPSTAHDRAGLVGRWAAAPSRMGSWGEKMRASPQGDVLMYKWNCTESFSRKPPRSECWKMDFFWLSLLLPGSIVWVSECPQCPGGTCPALSLAEEAGTGLGLECKHESDFFRTGREAGTRVPCPARFLQGVEGRVGT